MSYVKGKNIFIYTWNYTIIPLKRTDLSLLGDWLKLWKDFFLWMFYKPLRLEPTVEELKGLVSCHSKSCVDPFPVGFWTQYRTSHTGTSTDQTSRQQTLRSLGDSAGDFCVICEFWLAAVVLYSSPGRESTVAAVHPFLKQKKKQSIL